MITEKYIDMKSPLTGGKVKEVSDIEVKEFRKEKFPVHVRYCVCEDTGEQFTTTEQDTLQFNDLYSQYRIKHGIPFPDEIKAIRNGYGLNYAQISRILGFGANQYAKYEAGEVPSESNGKMIAAIRDKDVLMALLKGCRQDFSEAEFQRILNTIAKSELKREDISPLHKLIYQDGKRSIYNGYGSQDLERLFEMVRHLIHKTGEIFPTKLNKLMFYADFYHYRQSGVSISGLRYRALPYGPVPDHYATIYDNVPDVEKKIIEAHDMVGTLLYCMEPRAAEILSDSEINSLDHAIDKLSRYTVAEIIDLSHQEDGWQQAFASHSYIPYDTAFILKLI